MTPDAEQAIDEILKHLNYVPGDARDSCVVTPNTETRWRPSRWAQLRVFLTNLKTAHERVMMRYLQRRGWTVFYWEGPYTCGEQIRRNAASCGRHVECMLDNVARDRQHSR